MSDERKITVGLQNNKKNKYIFPLISAVGAAALFLLFCAFSGVAPFGSNSFLRNDGFAQYAPFLSEYVSRLKSGGSLLYSWNTGLGSNGFAGICYYLLSPFNLLALPFGASNIDRAMLLIVTVKAACIAASFSVFLQNKFEIRKITVSVFSLIFTFSGFFLAYYYNTMWLDALIALPLIALGIENIVKGKKSTLYFFALAYAIIVNFYIAFMICIFCVLYFFLLVFSQDVSKNKEQKQDEPIFPVMMKFGVSSLFAGLVSAAVILPVLYALGSTAAKSDFDTTGFFFNVLDFLSYHTDSVTIGTVEMTTDTAPYLMSSMLTAVLFPLFFTSKKIKPNEKIATAVVTVLFFLSMQIPKLNYLWHGLNAPTGLPYRFSFLYLFLIITVAFKTLLNIDSVPKWAFVFPIVIVGAAIGYAKFSQFSDHFTTYGLVLSAVAAAIYIVVLLIAKSKDGFKRVLPIVLSVLIIAELCLSNTGIVKSDGDVYEKHYSDLEAVEQVKEIIKNDSNTDFTRMEISDGKKVKNLSALYGYNGISTFSSMTDTNLALTQYCLGVDGNRQNSFKYSPQTPVYNAMFSLDYVYDNTGMISEDNPYYEKIGEVEGNGVYKVKYTLPLGYCADSAVSEWDPYIYQPSYSQTAFWYTATGVGNVFSYATLDSIEYHNCNSVDRDTVNKYYSALNEANESEHVHEDGETHEEGYEVLTNILESVGGVYSFKATANDFSIKFNYTVEKDGELFILATSGSLQKMTVQCGTETKEYDITDRKLYDVGYYHAGDVLTVTAHDPDRDVSEFKEGMPLSDSLQMSVASIDNDAFMSGYNHILENGTLNIEEFKDSHIKGTVNAAKDGVMVVSMPYDEGWTVTVDGENAELIKNESHIMMFSVSAGEHTVEMKYFPQGLKEGIFVSVASLLALALVMLLSKVRKMKAELAAEEEAKKASEKPEKDD